MFRMAIEFVMFVLSTGVLFSDECRKYRLAVLVAGLIAVASTISFLESVFDFGKSRSTPISTTSVPSASIPEPDRNRAKLKKNSGEVTVAVPRAPAPGPTADEIFWLSIKDSEAIALFEEFKRRYPASKHAAEASLRIEELKRRSPAWTEEPKSRMPQGRREYFSN